MRGTCRFFVLAVLCLAGGFGLSACAAEGSLNLGAPTLAQTEVGFAQSSARPNMVFILTDDQTVRDVRHMPAVRSLLVQRGTTFKNTFVTNSVCCPSRTTVLRGQYTHNHQIKGTKPPAGGFEKFRDLGLEKSTVATWLDSGGYRTVHIGKYLNGYINTTHVPPGWDEWYGFNGGGYYDFTLNENGRNVSYEGRNNYQTDVLSDKVVRYVRRAKDKKRPFFMHLAPWAPHGPAEPAPRHEDLFNKAKAPRPPSFNEKDVGDKPGWVRKRSRLTGAEVAEMDELYRNRLRTLRAVDEMVRDLVRMLRKTGQLDNTYIFFTTDNGFHMGQHRLSSSKWTAYEEDIRVPLIVRGPGVPVDRTLRHLVINNDFAPTFAELGRVSTPDFVDGRSMAPLMRSDAPPVKDWRRTFLVEAKEGGAYRRPAYRAVRTNRWMYVRYDRGRYSKRVERELYNLRRDPSQLRSRHKTARPELLRKLNSRLDALSRCSGESCRIAEDRAFGS